MTLLQKIQMERNHI